MSKLYVIGTPIGNLGDMTYRAVETLRSVDFICAEDTRVTAKLLNHFEIKKPMVSYHRHNCAEVGEMICNRIEAGEVCAIVTDAGMPCISDPGEDLVKLCYEKGIAVEVVPGPTAVASALAISGLSTSRFCFEGFLSTTKRLRNEHLAAVAEERRTLIFYEAPHKLIYTLKDMLDFFGDRRISICRELTKIHEEVIRTTLSEAVEYYSSVTPKGEFVLVIEGAEEKKEVFSLEDAVSQARSLVEKGMRAADACRQVAKASGFSKGELYAELLKEN